MSRRYKAELIVVNILNQRDINTLVEVQNQNAVLGNKFTMSIDAYTQQVKSDRKERLRELLTAAGCTGLHPRILVKTGVPYQKLLAIAKEEDVGVVVIGTKGRSNLSDVLFGSTAERMFRMCPVPLFSIRRIKEEKKQAET